MNKDEDDNLSADIYFIDELGNLVFPAEDDVEVERECLAMAAADEG